MAVPKRQRNNIFVKLKQFRYPHATMSILKQTYNNRQVCEPLSSRMRFYLFTDSYKLSPKDLRINARLASTYIPSPARRSTDNRATKRYAAATVFLSNCNNANSAAYS
jgi:hypothetical protein